MKHKKLFNNKIAKGLVSLITIVVLLSSILATSIFYENNITANIIRETSTEQMSASILITEVNDIKELSQLNEGWYHIKNSYVYYLEHFDSYVPLYIRVKNYEQQNGLLLVEEDGTVSLDETFEGLSAVAEEEKAENEITGEVTGFERVSGAATLVRPQDSICIYTTPDKCVKESDVCVFKLDKRCVKEGDKVYKDGKEFTAARPFWNWPPHARVLVDSQGNKIDPIPALGKDNQYYSNQLPFFKDSKGNEITPQQGDKLTRKEGNEYVTYVYDIDPNGYSFLSTPDGKKTIQFPDSSKRVDLSEWSDKPPTYPPWLPSPPKYEPSGFTGFQRGDDVRVSANAVKYQMDVSPEFQSILTAAAQQAPAVLPPRPDQVTILPSPTSGTPPAPVGQLIDFKGAGGESLTIDEAGNVYDKSTNAYYGVISYDSAEVTAFRQRLVSPAAPPPVAVITQPAPTLPQIGGGPAAKPADGTVTSPAVTPIYASIDIANARFNQKNPEFKIGETIIIKGEEHIVRASPSGRPVYINIATKVGETHDGKVAYLWGDRVRVTDHRADSYKPPEDGKCSGSICLRDGVFMPPEEYKKLRANEFYVIKSDGTPFKLESTNRQDAEIEKMQFGDPNLKVISGSQLPAEKEKKPSTQQLLEGKQKYLIRVSKPDGQIVTAEIWTDEANKVGVANNKAEFLGGNVVSGSIKRPTFIVTIPGFLKPFVVEGNDPNNAIDNIMKELSNKGLPLPPKSSITAKSEVAGVAGTAEVKPPLDAEYAEINGMHMVKLPTGGVQEYKTKDEALKAVSEINARLAQQRFEKSGQESIKKHGLTLLSEKDEDGIKLAEKEGKIWRFYKTSETSGEYKPIQEPSYITREDVGDVRIMRTHETEKRTLQETRVITKDFKSAIINDEDTINRIRAAQGKGFNIVQVGVVSEQKDLILEFRDPQTNLLLDRRKFTPDYTAKSGTKTVERYNIVYLDENKNELSKEDVDRIQKEEKRIIKGTSELAETNVFEKGKPKSSTGYFHESVRDGTGYKRVYQATEVGENGDITRIIYGEGIYGEGGKWMSVEVRQVTGLFADLRRAYQDFSEGLIYKDSGNFKNDEEKNKYRNELNTIHTQTRSREIFAGIQRKFTEFQGLGFYAPLFGFSDDDLLEWRNEVDKRFATFYLGSEYWTSAICGQYLDGEEEGIAYAETLQGLGQIASHIEATRTAPIQTPTGQEFIYKITFNVRNGDYDKDFRAPEEMHINIVLKGERTATVFKEDQTVKRGSSFGRIGRNAIVQDSTAVYTKVCIRFDKMPLKWKLDGKELCNKIQESSGSATAVSGTGTSTPSSGGGGGTPTGDVNDF